MCVDLLTKSATSSWLTLLRLPSPIIKPEMEFINICLKFGSFVPHFCIFFIFTKYIHSYNYSSITFSEAHLYIFTLQAQWAEPPWGAEPRFDLCTHLSYAAS
jgi:hypothetical protein